MKLPKGVSDFKKLREEGFYYVDKTLFIEELRQVFAEVILIPRPRRFGKTLNLSMLRYFYEISEESNAHLFENTAIWQKEEYRKIQGTYPVILVSFKSCKHEQWEKIYADMTTVIAHEFRRHLEVLEPKLKQHELNNYMSIIDSTASPSQYTNSLYFLSMLLAEHYKKRVIILIDDYDTPIHTSYANGYYKQMVDFLLLMLEACLKDNSYLHQGVLTGILNISSASIFGGLNNITVKTLFNDAFSDKFGFTQQEVDQMLFDSELSQESDSIKNWYSGYRFGKSPIYNPWSIINCLSNKGSFNFHLAKTSNNELIKKLIAQAPVAIKSKLELLASGKEIEQRIEESIILSDLESHSDLLLSFMLFSGYLSFEQYSIKKGDVYASLKIPNQETKLVFNELICTISEESIADNHVCESKTILVKSSTLVGE